MLIEEALPASSVGIGQQCPSPSGRGRVPDLRSSTVDGRGARALERLHGAVRGRRAFVRFIGEARDRSPARAPLVPKRLALPLGAFVLASSLRPHSRTSRAPASRIGEVLSLLPVARARHGRARAQARVVVRGPKVMGAAPRRVRPAASRPAAPASSSAGASPDRSRTTRPSPAWSSSAAPSRHPAGVRRLAHPGGGGSAGSPQRSRARCSPPSRCRSTSRAARGWRSRAWWCSCWRCAGPDSLWVASGGGRAGAGLTAHRA